VYALSTESELVGRDHDSSLARSHWDGIPPWE
jgi:hypothetical protein